MDLTTATPVEIDTVLAPIWEREASAQSRIVNYKRREAEIFTTIEKVKRGEKVLRVTTAMDGIELMEDLARIGRFIVAEGNKLAAAEAEAAPYEAEYTRRGGWNRVFLATSSNGHAHNGTECSTCHNGQYRTAFAWLIQYSGKPEAEIVADAGERACTICYESAPAEVLKRKTKMFTPDEIEAQQAREDRGAAKAQRDATKNAKAINAPDGSVLRGKHGRIDTEVTAIREAVDGLADRYHRLRVAQVLEADADLAPFFWSADKLAEFEADGRKEAMPLIEAIAAKHGRTVEDVLAELEPKAEAKAKRNGSGKAWVAEFKRQSSYRLEERDAYLAKCKAEGREPWEALNLRWLKG